MRALLAVLALAASLPHASAVELIINGVSPSVAAQIAQSLGYYDAVHAAIVAKGPISGGGSYFLNIVGTYTYPDPVATTTCSGPGGSYACPVIDTAPGFWMRLRHNGDPATLAPKIAAASAALSAAGGAIYQWQQTLNGGAGCWSSDDPATNPNAACAEAFVGGIGPIL